MTDLDDAKQLMLDVVGSCVDVNATVSDPQVRGALWVNCIVDLQDKLITVVEKIYDMGVCDGKGERQSRTDEE